MAVRLTNSNYLFDLLLRPAALEVVEETFLSFNDGFKSSHNKCFNSVCMLLLSFLNKTFVLLFVFFPFIRNSGWWGLNKPTTKPSNMMMMTNRFTFISSVSGTYRGERCCHPHQRRHSSAPPCLDTWSLMHFSCLCLWRKLNNYLWSESRRRNVYLHSIFKVAE